MNSSAALRKEKLEKRDEVLLNFIQRGVPLATIAGHLGMHKDYAKTVVKGICKEYDVTYTPRSMSVDEEKKTLPLGVTGESHAFRRSLGERLYYLGEREHHLELQMQLGLSPKSQHIAKDNPFAHDWTIGQLERFARHQGTSFKEFMLENLLTEREMDILRPWLKTT